MPNSNERRVSSGVVDSIALIEPRGVGEVSVEYWRWLVEQLRSQGRLHSYDAPTLELLAHAHHDREVAVKILDKYQPSQMSMLGVDDQRELAGHPAWRLKSEASKRMDTLLMRLGITASARNDVSGRGGMKQTETNMNPFVALAVNRNGKA